MKGILVPLTGIMLCAATLNSVAGDALETKQEAELHAAVTICGHHPYVARGPHSLGYITVSQSGRWKISDD